MSIAAVTRMIRNPTVESVLASFQTAVDDLRAISAARVDEAVNLSARKREIETRITQAEEESARARLVAGRLEALIK